MTKAVIMFRDIITGKMFVKEETYRTDEHGFVYYVGTTTDEDTFIRIPCPENKWHQTKAPGIKYADARMIKECLDDYGLCELDREWLVDGSVVIYGF